MVLLVVLVSLVSISLFSNFHMTVLGTVGACTDTILVPGLGIVHSKEPHVLEEFGTEFGRMPPPPCHPLSLLV